MIEAVLRAFQNELFVDNEPAESDRYFPEMRETLELYYQILREAHLLSLEFQRMDSSIGEVIPG